MHRSDANAQQWQKRGRKTTQKKITNEQAIKLTLQWFFNVPFIQVCAHSVPIDDDDDSDGDGDEPVICHTLYDCRMCFSACNQRMNKCTRLHKQTGLIILGRVPSSDDAKKCAFNAM